MYTLTGIEGSNPFLSSTRRHAKGIMARCRVVMSEANEDGLTLNCCDHLKIIEGYLMYFVYTLQSDLNTERYYVGLTTNIDKRLLEHNSGKSIHTNKFRPWQLIRYIAFQSKDRAEKFELYLKTSSGRTFAKRRL